MRVFEKRGSLWGDYSDRAGKRRRVPLRTLDREVADARLAEMAAGGPPPWTVVGIDKQGQSATKALCAATARAAAKQSRYAKVVAVFAGRHTQAWEPQPVTVETSLPQAVASYRDFWVGSVGRDLRESRHRTWSKDGSNLKMFAAWADNRGLNASEVTEAHAQEYLQERLQGVSASTVNKDRRVNRAFWVWLVKRQYATVNPWAEIKQIRTVRKDPTTNTKEEVIALLEALAGKPLRPLVAAAALAGLRSTELRNLRCEDVRLGEREIRVVCDEDRVTKGRRGRVVPILFIELQEALAELEGEGPAFRSPSGRRWRAEGLMKAVREASERVGVFFRLQKLRRTFATLAAKDVGAPMAMVQQWLGHASMKTTETYYVGARNGWAKEQVSLGEGTNWRRA